MVIENLKNTDVKTFKSKREKQPSPPTKIVIRKLPPTYTEEEFKEAISPIPEFNYFSFVPADKKLGQHAFSRAYINFICPDEIYNFRDKFDGYVFVDQKGNEFPAIVEYAPFQKIPKVSSNPKKDLRCGTIDEDPDYVQFLNALENPPTEVLPTIENLLEEIETIEKETRGSNGLIKIKTPLLEYVEQRNADRLRPGERRRRKELERKQAREEARRKRKELNREWYNQQREERREERKRREEERQKWKEKREEERERLRKEREKRESQIKKEKTTKFEEKSEFKDNVDNSVNETNPKKQSENIPKDSKVKDEDYQKDIKQEKVLEEKNYEKESTTEASKEEIVQPSKNENNESKQNNNIGNNNDKTPENEMRETVKINELKETVEINENESRDEPEDVLPDRDECKDSENVDDAHSEKDDKSSKDPRTERRIRNKDRPAMQLYRPGQSRLKTLKSEEEPGSEKGNSGESSSSSSSPVMAFSDQEKKTGKETVNVKDEHQYKDSEKEKTTKQKESFKNSYHHYDRKPQSNRYRDTRPRYWEEEKPSYRKYNDYSKYNKDDYYEPKGEKKVGRKGYSYYQERENKGKFATASNKGKDQDSNSHSYKSVTYRRTTHPE